MGLASYKASRAGGYLNIDFVFLLVCFNFCFCVYFCCVFLDFYFCLFFFCLLVQGISWVSRDVGSIWEKFKN